MKIHKLPLRGRFAGLAVIALALSASVHATVWDAADTPNVTLNPNGVWGYGYDPASVAGYQFKPFDTLVDAGLWLWLDAGYNDANTPSFVRNTGDETIAGLMPGGIALHPGPTADGDVAILRFTAPADGFYAVSARFFEGDAGETDAWVVRNGDFASPLASLGITSVNPSFDAKAVALAFGDTLDFVVGNHGSYYGDTTPLSVQITTAVPEPTTALMMLAGAMVLTGVARRR